MTKCSVDAAENSPMRIVSQRYAVRILCFRFFVIEKGYALPCLCREFPGDQLAAFALLSLGIRSHFITRHSVRTLVSCHCYRAYLALVIVLDLRDQPVKLRAHGVGSSGTAGALKVLLTAKKKEEFAIRYSHRSCFIIITNAENNDNPLTRNYHLQRKASGCSVKRGERTYQGGQSVRMVRLFASSMSMGSFQGCGHCERKKCGNSTRGGGRNAK